MYRNWSFFFFFITTNIWVAWWRSKNVRAIEMPTTVDAASPPIKTYDQRLYAHDSPSALSHRLLRNGREKSLQVNILNKNGG